MKMKNIIKAKETFEAMVENTDIILLKDDVKDIAEALEKQISKKITHEATLHKCCTCPNCKNVIDRFEQFGESKVRIKYNYCHFCGQKLNWE
jgi:hypothetical protein